ncbi:type III polyketide synthase [Fulvivirga sediminis]|uniref:Type III polyketide synthase n=1 Tax=Fulvivirga sediminis TaxID=2803949 RepID=A0A937F1S1_9BACT|nr:type III polyketide synthase [Fulvivirga sediminis]MBL3654696.1 type III polyketide synthase [Fulvivirga sediminis]
MNVYITGTGTATPEHKIAQAEVWRFMSKAHQMNEQESQKLRLLYRATGIENRYSVIPDYGSQNTRSFYPDTDNLEPFPSTESRANLFRSEAKKLGEEAANQALENVSRNEITHLITVSCTGMYAPGIDIELIDQLGLNTSVERTGINFMGCYAAFNAIKTGRSICLGTPDAKVLIVCVELCSIHFQKEKIADYLLANAIFGDGAAALVMEGKPSRKPALQTMAFHCDLNPGGKKDMAWKIGNYGFEMRLSSYIPSLIEQDILLLTNRLRQKHSIESFQYYAIHPGGKKILEVIEKQLGISREDNRFAYQILKKYGNMSSTTIIFVLQEIMKNLKADDNNKKLLALAFGPGLTLESMILNIIT